MSGIQTIHNMGPFMERCLTAAGIETAEELREVGPIVAYIKIKSTFPDKVNINALWAMVTGLQNRPFGSLSEEERDAIKQELINTKI